MRAEMKDEAAAAAAAAHPPAAHPAAPADRTEHSVMVEAGPSTSWFFISKPFCP